MTGKQSSSCAPLQVRKADGKKSKEKAQAEADKAQERLDKYSARMTDLKVDLPEVQVGTLEELLYKMELDTEGNWDEVMFIPPGATQAT